MSKTISVDQASDPLTSFWEAICHKGIIRLFLAVTVVITAVQAFLLLSHRHDQQDFAHYFASSQLWIDGAAVYKSDLNERYQQLGWENFDEPIYQATNPPGLVVLFAPFALLNPQVAHVAWMLTQLLCLALAIWQTWRCVKGGITFDGYCFVLGVFLLLPFVASHLFYSQVQLLLLAMILTAYRLVLIGKRKSHNFSWESNAACGIVAVASLVKIYPVVLLPWFVWHSSNRWSMRMASAFLTGLLLVGGVFLTGVQLWVDFYQNAMPVISSWMRAGYECFTLANASHQFGEAVFGGSSGNLFLKTGTVIGLLVLLLFFVQLIRRSPATDKGLLNIEFALLLLLMLFCGGTCWWHYLVFLIFPLQVAAGQIGNRLTFSALAFSILTILLFANINLPLTSIEFVRPFVNQRPLWGMILLAMFLASCLKTNRPTALT